MSAMTYIKGKSQSTVGSSLGLNETKITAVLQAVAY